jgi:predicted glycogen debranching enzyme
VRRIKQAGQGLSPNLSNPERKADHSMNAFKISSPSASDFATVSAMEWLETNGLGGYSCSTVAGIHTRRYHGLLVASTEPPVGRKVLLSKLDETIVIGQQRFELGANQYPGAIHPRGYQFLKSFDRDLFPVFEFEAGNVTIKKTIAAVHGENTTLVLYDVVKASQPFRLEFLPLCSARDHHNICHANDAISQEYAFRDGIFSTRNYQDSPELFISVPKSEFIAARHWYHNFEYELERYRGLEYQEDLYNHGKFFVQLKEGDRLGIIISTENPAGRDAFELFEKEIHRRDVLVASFSFNNNIRRLVFAADQFVVKRGADLKTIIAGYPWFSDWGRDTMIALPGICLVTGKYDDAKKILRAFASSVSEGMLPNRFLDHGEKPEYNTIDATLWFFQAIYKYVRYTNDKEFVREILPVLRDIIAWHYKGTRFNIHVDTDQLLTGGADGVQLTWMDARVGDWVVTPRRGKAVEINALWYNALCVMAGLSDDPEESKAYQQKAAQAKTSFNELFWNTRQAALFDHVDGSYCNDDIRPNQIYALSLAFPVINEERAKSVLKRVTDKLFTSRGLRSLSPDNRAYVAVYGGDPWARDSAYHQGTVWSFLMGPYIDALFFVEGDQAKPGATKIISSFFEHLDERGIGTVSEIFDAQPPHAPRGCFAQAWGVGEVLRVAIEYKLFKSLDS